MCMMHESICLTPFAAVVSLDSLLTPSEVEGRAPFDIPEVRADPIEILDASRAKDAVASFLLALTEPQRDLVFRVFWNDETQASIARSRGVSEATISKTLKKILDKGRIRLRAYKDAPSTYIS